MSLEAIRFHDGQLELLDQLQLPFTLVYDKIESVQDAWLAINQMKVRGAPAIAISGVLSVVVELLKRSFDESQIIKKFTFDSLDYLVTARPTAVNMADAAIKIKAFCESEMKQYESDPATYKSKLVEKMSSMLSEDIAVNKSMGQYGASDIISKSGSEKKFNILTHCNTGSLATAGYGTALGVIRRLNELNLIDHCYCTETRPYNQGSRLTAFELVYEKIPSTLICDNMVGLLMSRKTIDAVIVGADRVVSNGDTANKIGTYQLAVLAKHHNVPFYVAVPTTTLDFTKSTGGEIEIEERSTDEITHFKGQRVAAQGINCWNPAFDVTPGNLVTGGFITEFGVFKAEELSSKLKDLMKSQ